MAFTTFSWLFVSRYSVQRRVCHLSGGLYRGVEGPPPPRPRCPAALLQAIVARCDRATSTPTEKGDTWGASYLISRRTRGRVKRLNATVFRCWSTIRVSPWICLRISPWPPVTSSPLWYLEKKWVFVILVVLQAHMSLIKTPAFFAFYSMTKVPQSCSSCTAVWMRSLLSGALFGSLLLIRSLCSESVPFYFTVLYEESLTLTLRWLLILWHLFLARNSPIPCFHVSWGRWPGETRSSRSTSTSTRCRLDPWMWLLTFPNWRMLLFLWNNFVSCCVQSQDNKRTDVITGSLLEGIDKHQGDRKVVRSIIFHRSVCSFERSWWCGDLSWAKFSMSPGANRCACPHGNCRSSHRGNRDHRSLVELDRGFSLAQTGGMTLPPTHPLTHCQTTNVDTLSCFWLSLSLTLRFKQRSMRSCARCWRDVTPNTATDTGFLSCVRSYTKFSGSGRSPHWRCSTKPSETAG